MKWGFIAGMLYNTALVIPRCSQWIWKYICTCPLTIVPWQIENVALCLCDTATNCSPSTEREAKLESVPAVFLLPVPLSFPVPIYLCILCYPCWIAGLVHTQMLHQIIYPLYLRLSPRNNFDCELIKLKHKEKITFVHSQYVYMG